VATISQIPPVIQPECPPMYSLMKTDACRDCGHAMIGNEPSSVCWACHGRGLLKLVTLRERLIADLEGRPPFSGERNQSRLPSVPT
jgi:hypothetical protein